MLLGEEGAYPAYRVAIGLRNRARGAPLYYFIKTETLEPHSLKSKDVWCRVTGAKVHHYISNSSISLHDN